MASSHFIQKYKYQWLKYVYNFLILNQCNYSFLDLKIMNYFTNRQLYHSLHINIQYSICRDEILFYVPSNKHNIKYKMSQNISTDLHIENEEQFFVFKCFHSWLMIVFNHRQFIFETLYRKDKNKIIETVSV